MSEIRAEIEHLVRAEVRVDVAKLCAYYATERAEFDGSDEDFVRQSLDEMGYDLLTDSGQDVDDGIQVTPDWDEIDVTILGVIA